MTIGYTKYPCYLVRIKIFKEKLLLKKKEKKKRYLKRRPTLKTEIALTGKLTFTYNKI